MSVKRRVLIGVAVVLIGVVFVVYQGIMKALEDPFIALFEEK